MSNWIFDMFSSKDEIKKEAELTNQEKEWERKVQAHDWVNDVMNIDEQSLAKEEADKMAAEESAVGAAEPFDEVGMIMAFEGGELGDADVLKLFSELVRNGHAWSLQGSYGRMAKSLIEAGYLDQKGTILKEVGSEVADEACMASFKAALNKTAAFEKGDTQKQTIEKDYELKVKGLSDYNLAEMIAEYECMEKGVATLSHNEYKEDALKSVKSGRDASEKKLLKFLGDHTLLDWKKSFKEMEKSEVKEAAEKDLYSEWKESKMAWESKTKFDATSDKEKLEQMDGVGKEEEKGQVGKEAAKTEFVKCPNCDSKTARKVGDKVTCVTCDYGMKDKEASLKEAATPVEIIEKKVDKLIKDTIDKKFEEMAPAAPVVDPMSAVDPMALPIVTEDSPADKVLDKEQIPHMEPGETPEHEKKEMEDAKKDDKKEDDKEASLKQAAPPVETGTPSNTLPVDVPGDERGYHGWKNFETYMVGLWLDNDHELYDHVLEMAKSSADMGELSQQIKALVEENEPDLGASVYADLLNSAMSDVDWYEVAEHYQEYMTPEAPELNEKPEAGAPAAAPAAKPEEASMGEIVPAASKKDVLKKVAEIDSPWKVVKNDKGEEIIARVAPVATEKKSKEKDKELGINSQDLK